MRDERHRRVFTQISGGILFIMGILLRSQFVNLDDITPEMRSFSPYILVRTADRCRQYDGLFTRFR